ncbi:MULTISPECIES: ATP-binding cassette domain-containing protein [unclassified Paenibacillus]|uniref:ABC transporter ATP-binding protein n=1 Tax=unclassified Paenibacillus TaxID=185978 RepID=UPI001AE5EACA|nr:MULTISPECIES: ATP-binding cassette domain-containing protein [unclassified Paenibacillus]MBP1157745.1 ABC-2 type transport system ATP-binding protein [Paenibacillus sp. PvP091]MBP1171519.1 ABC-2 type transport system ATP-binding protein [Paenibacillus sp. PvR098]MBP2442547.1 ABC-2 type transport system ATP-binding protein [Paenibacillus sp. PvP052]
MLEVKQVSKWYENQRGVQSVDFSMSRGEIVGFLGPNGAGKTTTMRMITGYLNPTQGTITIDGLSMTDHPKKARQKIGYLPETPPLYPEMTVRAYLQFIADLRGIPAKEQKRRLGEVVERLGLQGRERQIIRSLSKGYKQRVGLAQAILHQPDLLVLDEPTSGLDPKQIIEIRQLIRELGENHTVLLSTHILPEINTLCNRVLIINQGRIVLDGQPDRLAHTMGEAFEVSLEVKGPREAVLTELRGLPGVTDVRELDGEAGVTEPKTAVVDEDTVSSVTASPAETVKVLVSAAAHEDIREVLFYRMAERRYPILSMKKESLSLEDIFLKLTTSEALDGQAGSEASSEEVIADA